MDNLKNDNVRAPLEEAATNLMNGGKKFANELYEEGLNRVQNAEKNVKEYSDEILLTVRKNPLTAVLVAAGVGFLLSALLKK